nr:hypothetical transcript [Hymenolepis microstoma]
MDHKKSITQSKSKRNKKHPNNTVPTPGCANEEQISQLEKAVEIKSPIQHVDSSGRSANQNQSSRSEKHYFSEENLLQDVHLKNLLCANQGVCPFKDLLEFFRLKMVNTDVGDLVECANSIENVELVVDSYFIPIGYRLIIPLPEPKLDDKIGTAISELPGSSHADMGGCPIHINDVFNISQCSEEYAADASNMDIPFDFMSNQIPLSIVDPNTLEQILPENKPSSED